MNLSEAASKITASLIEKNIGFMVAPKIPDEIYITDYRGCTSEMSGVNPDWWLWIKPNYIVLWFNVLSEPDIMETTDVSELIKIITA
jgi:hypothetical protein